jgi:glycosyltransferase involved in cell wall biosynthesis
MDGPSNGFLVPPTISIITSTLNAARWLPDLIKSIRLQTYPHKEWIVIDGGAVDGTKELLRCNEDTISYWLNEPDHGIYSAWNKGIDRSRGEWICFLGADDRFWDTRTLEDVARRLKKLPLDVRVAYGRVLLINGDGKLLDSLDEVRANKGNRYDKLMRIPRAGLMHRRSLFDQHGRFDESFHIAGDYEMLLRELNTADFTFLPDLTVAVMRQGGISNSQRNSLLLLREVRRAQKMHGKLIPGLVWISALARVHIRLLLWSIIGERIGSRLLDLGRSVLGKPPFWTQI